MDTSLLKSLSIGELLKDCNGKQSSVQQLPSSKTLPSICTF